MTDSAPAYNQVAIYTSDTAARDRYFPVLGPIQAQAAATFGAKNTIGDATKDSEDFLSTLILSDLSGGINVEDMNEGSDTARCWTAFADIKRPGKIALNTRVESITPPVGAPTGPAYSCGQIVNTPYFLIGTASAMVAYGRKESDGTWYTGVALNPDIVPVGKPVNFVNKIFVPCGASGYLIISEADSVGAPGVPTLTNVTTGAIPWPGGTAAHTFTAGAPDVNPPTAVAFCVFDQKLFALSTGGAVAWSFTGADDSWTWDYNATTSKYPYLQSGEDPQNLIGFYDPQGNPQVFVISDRGGYIYNRAAPTTLVNTPIQFAPHPDFGGAAAIWRAGEDMHIAAGLDSVRYTSANVVVPLSGLARDDGVPQELFGSILDFEPETSELYALVGPVTNGASGYAYNDQLQSNPVPGTGDGDFDDVRGMSVDSAGSVFACDENNERVQELNTTLDYVAKFGSAGTGNGEFSSTHGPYDCAHDSSDALFVVDKGNSRIQKFTAANAYSSQFGSFDDGTAAVAYSELWTLQNTYLSTGTGDTNLDTPAQCATDSSGNVYIADTANNRLKKVDSSGAFVSHITSLTAIVGVCIDSSDNIYVTGGDASLIYIKKYNSSLTLQWTQSGAPTNSARYSHCTTDGTSLWVTFNSTVISGFESHLCSTGAGSPGPPGPFFGTLGTGNGQFDTTRGIDTDGTYVYIVDQGNSRVQKFTVAGAYVSQFSIPASCRGCALNSAGTELYVANFANDLVNHYTTDGVLLDTFSQADAEGIAVHTDGTVWVTNASSDNLAEWELTITAAVAAIPPATGLFNLPESIAIKASSGRIYVCDTGNHRVQYFTSAGAYEGTIGANTHNASTGAMVASAATGSFDTPVAVAVNQSTGDVYVVDQGNDRVQQFTATGTYIRSFGTSGTGDGQFSLPTAIAIHPTLYTVYVADATRDDVQIFSSAGTFITKLGSSGSGNGQFSSPSGIAFDATGANLYVSDLTNEDVQEFLFSSATSGQTYPWLAAWTGIGWYGKKKFPTIGVSPNWMHVTATATNYSLYLGLSDGTIYKSPLKRYFHNPRRAFLAGEDQFEATGEIVTPRFDAAMLGFWKIASHMVVFMDNATSTETLTIEYQTDEITTWTELGTVDSTDKTYLPFGLVSGEFSEGLAFNWIQFRLTLARGEEEEKTPIIKSLVLAYMKLPQNTNAFNFVIPFPKDGYGDFRTGKEIRDALDALVTSRKFFTLRFPDQDGVERSYRGYLTGLSGDDAPSELTDGQRRVSFIQLADSEL
jgi:tripartite motif-containing protein 71